MHLAVRSVLLFAGQGGNLYGSQSWPDHRTQRPQMAHQTLAHAMERLALGIRSDATSGTRVCRYFSFRARLEHRRFWVETH